MVSEDFPRVNNSHMRGEFNFPNRGACDRWQDWPNEIFLQKVTKNQKRINFKTVDLRNNNAFKIWKIQKSKNGYNLKYLRGEFFNSSRHKPKNF